ncbi:MAG: type II toxin-antitoxin system HipA family toxin [Spirochaetaceae bacterium]|nr:type II toxin-antitoxin system HipA family toxin [Spirochaetaceae bacterium]
MKLNVFLFNTLAGYLFSTADRGVVFAYDENYVNNNGMPLSLSLPLQKEEFSQKKCMPYFSGLLPEGSIRNRISEYLHISESSTIKFLQALGGECSGTVSFYNSEEEANFPENKWHLSEENYIPFSMDKLNSFIKESKNKPMLLGSKDLRLSLAGAQEKISLAYFNDTWHLPKNGAPSTHILKPTRSGELSTIAQNEFFCMNLAEKLNLPVPKTQILELDDLSVFVCQRYDRKFDSEKPSIQRIHQEDFCQALGIMNDIKYQADGGPSFKDCFNLIQEKFSDKLEQINIFLKSILFNYLIGNCDSHGKNFSLIYENSKIKLSPLYDLVSTTVYPSLTTKMAMKLGSNYEIEKISPTDFLKQAELFEIKNRFWLSAIEDFSKNLIPAFSEISNMQEFSKCNELIELLHKQINSRLNILLG